MSDVTLHPPQPLARPEILRDDSQGRALTVVERPLTTFEWIGNQGWLRKIAILVLIILFIQKRPRGLFALKGRSVEA